jgi:hypothetical protein
MLQLLVHSIALVPIQGLLAAPEPQPSALSVVMMTLAL